MQKLFRTNTGEEKPLVFATPCKQRAVEVEDFVVIPNVTTIPKEAEDDFKTVTGDVKSILRKLHKTFGCQYRENRTAGSRHCPIEKPSWFLSHPRSIQNQVIDVNKDVVVISTNMETFKIFDVLKNEDTVKFFLDLSAWSKGRYDCLAQVFWDALSTPIKNYVKPMASFYSNWTAATEPGVLQVPGNILQSTISGNKAQTAQLTTQIKNLNAKIYAAAGEVVDSVSGNV